MSVYLYGVCVMGAMFAVILAKGPSIPRGRRLAVAAVVLTVCALWPVIFVGAVVLSLTARWWLT